LKLIVAQKKVGNKNNKTEEMSLEKRDHIYKPVIDVCETDDIFKITFKMMNRSKGDIDIDEDSHCMTLRTKETDEQEEELAPEFEGNMEHYSRSDHSASFTRVPLPENINKSQLHKEFDKDGNVIITVPKFS